MFTTLKSYVFQSFGCRRFFVDVLHRSSLQLSCTFIQYNFYLQRQVLQTFQLQFACSLPHGEVCISRAIRVLSKYHSNKFYSKVVWWSGQPNSCANTMYCDISTSGNCCFSLFLIKIGSSKPMWRAGADKQYGSCIEQREHTRNHTTASLEKNMHRNHNVKWFRRK